MLRNNRFVYIILCFTLLGYGGWWILRWQKHVGVVTHKEIYQDAFGSDIAYTKYDGDGKVIQRFHAASLQHFNNNDSTVSRPELFVYHEKTPWKLTAVRARTQDDNNQIDLYEQVVLEQQVSQNNGTKMTTQHLRYFPKTQLVTTQEHVTMEQAGMRISATGMRADLKSQKITLLKQARGIYDKTDN